MFLLLWSVLFVVSLKADNILHLSPKKVGFQDSSAKITLEIDSLEQNSKNIDEYTTKYFKKRNYSAPFSSEVRDYQDSILIQKVPKKHKNPKETFAKESHLEAGVDSNDSGNSKDSTNSTTKITDSKGMDSKTSKDSTHNLANLATPQPFQEPPKVYKKVLDSNKPKVVIIIDDIANTAQLRDIKAFHSDGLKLTPSIFPVTENNTSMLESIATLEFFMVHLPLEAFTYKDGLDTISIYDSPKRIKEKIARIKRIMPHTHYINNHTGSKFTERKDNVEMLLSALDLHNISFVDSRTTPNTALPEIARAQNRLILSRDIFIDNQLDANSLATQISEGVKIAKARGYAILIAHPHKETLNAIRVAKNGALKEVDVIYLNELDFLLKKANITQYAQVLNLSNHKPKTH